VTSSRSSSYLLRLYRRNIDHGLVYGWNATTYDVPISSNVHPENFTVKGWALLHHAGFLTYPHHDAEGSLTWVRMEVGIKLWVVFRPKDRYHDRKHLQDFAIRLGNFTENEAWIRENCESECITLLPGDIMYVYSFDLFQCLIQVLQESFPQARSMRCTHRLHR
jgi:hypothetical protein